MALSPDICLMRGRSVQALKACLHKAKESYSVLRTGVVRGKTHVAGGDGRGRDIIVRQDAFVSFEAVAVTHCFPAVS